MWMLKSSESKTSGKNVADADDFVPKAEWEIQYLCRVMPQHDIDAMWDRLLMSGVPKLWVRGQWCVHQFKGVQVWNYSDSSSSRQVSSVAKVSDPSALRETIAQADEIVVQAGRSLKSSTDQQLAGAAPAPSEVVPMNLVAALSISTQ